METNDHFSGRSNGDRRAACRRSTYSKGEKVRALTRNPLQANLPAGVEVVAGDLSEPSMLVTALTGESGMHLITTGAEYTPLQTGPEIVQLAEKAGIRMVTVLWNGEKGPFESAVEASALE